jgi:hypothetical protein
MIKASEVREIVERVIENEVAKLKEDAIQFCEEISKDIEVCANKKYCNIVVTVPNGINRKYVAEILKDNGYSINFKSDGKLDIVW